MTFHHREGQTFDLGLGVEHRLVLPAGASPPYRENQVSSHVPTNRLLVSP
jgi:hypothetical protein